MEWKQLIEVVLAGWFILDRLVVYTHAILNNNHVALTVNESAIRAQVSVQEEFNKSHPHRHGLLSMETVGVGLLNKGVKENFQIEVEEISQQGDMSCIKYIASNGDESDQQGIKEQLPRWVTTNAVKWLN